MADSKKHDPEPEGLHADPEIIKGELHVDPKITESLNERPKADPKTVERLLREREEQGFTDVSEETKRRLGEILASARRKTDG